MTMTDHPHDPSSPVTAARWPRVRRGATGAVLLLLGGSLGACSVFDGPITAGVAGWEVACINFGEYEDMLPNTVCLWKQIDGGASDFNMAAACAQERNAFYGTNETPEDYLDFAHIWKVEGELQQCLVEDVGELDAHYFPVTAIEDPDPTQSNYITCIPVDEIEITDGMGSYQVFLQSGRCVDPDLTYAENCEELCEQWQQAWPGYDQFTQGEDQGDCSVGNWLWSLDEDAECSAFVVPGSILASSATLSFVDPSNSISVPTTGALIYDDTACSATICEPGLFFKVEAGTAAFAYAEVTGATHAVALANVELGVQHAVQTQLGTTTGALSLPDVELYLMADDLSVDGVSLGALDAHEFMEGATVTHEPTANLLVIEGDVTVSALSDATIHVVVEADFGETLQAWPWSEG